ncbi:uncharacterized protein TNCV_4302631 [Trichonephila clavipes]|nr:uncharacterized protein TNCV_4302631 [Trichonephila clavipes]
MMGRRLHLRVNVHDLARQLEKICQEIPLETTRILYHSIARRVTACIQARGSIAATQLSILQYCLLPKLLDFSADFNFGVIFREMENCKKKRSSGQRPKKKRSQGNKFLKKTISGESKRKKTNFLRKSPNDSAFYRKLPSEKYLLDSCEADISQHFKGYWLIDISLFLGQLEKYVCCLECHGKIKINEKSSVGLSSSFLLMCSSCKMQKKKSNPCELIGTKKTIPEICRRSVLAMRCIGQGLSALSTFCTIMSLPKPVSLKVYDSINIKIADVCETLANATMSDAALEEKVLDGTRNCIAVSGDSTCKTRGHTSLVGICTFIGAECGKVSISRLCHPSVRNIFYEYAILSPTINFVVLIAVLYNLLWFINVNEQNIKKWASVISVLKEDETDQAIEEPDEIMHINRDSESKYDKSDRHETFELNCNFQMLPKELYQEN